VALDFLLDVDFLDGETLVDGVGEAGGGGEEAFVEIEGVGEAVGGVDAEDQGAVAAAGELEAGSGGDAGFADSAFAAEEEDSHLIIIALGEGVDRAAGLLSRAQSTADTIRGDS
jgi:hypothetical protein